MMPVIDFVPLSVLEDFGVLYSRFDKKRTCKGSISSSPRPPPPHFFNTIRFLKKKAETAFIPNHTCLEVEVLLALCMNENFLD